MEKEKNWNGKDWIVSLGSVWVDSDNISRVATLKRDDSKRRLDLYWANSDNVWLETCRFAAVSKSSSQNLDTGKLGSSSPLETRVLELEKQMESLRKLIKF